MPGAFLWPLLPVQIAANLYLLARSYTVGIGPAYLRAMKDGYGRLGEIFAVRRGLQATRRASLRNLAGALTWSPLKVSRRAPSLRPVGASRCAATGDRQNGG